MFVIANLFFGILDLTGKPEFLLNYKIQEEKTVPVCWGLGGVSSPMG